MVQCYFIIAIYGSCLLPLGQMILRDLSKSFIIASLFIFLGFRYLLGSVYRNIELQSSHNNICYIAAFFNVRNLI